MLYKIDSTLPMQPVQTERVSINPFPKWYSAWKKEAVRAMLSDLINANIRWLREEHERLSKEMAIQRHHLFLDLANSSLRKF